MPKLLNVKVIIVGLVLIFFAQKLLAKKFNLKIIENEYQNSEINTVKDVLIEADHVINKLFISVEKLDNDEQVLSTQEYKLGYFLHGPDNCQEIIDNIAKEMPDISLLEMKDDLCKSEESSYQEILNILFEQEKIDNNKYQELTKKYSPISSIELMQLFENGIVKAKKNYLIKLRTGKNYGDILSFTEKIHIVVERAKKEGIIKDNNSSLLNVLTGESKKEIANLFSLTDESWETILFDAKNLEKIREYLMFFSTVNSFTWHNIGNGGNIWGAPPSVTPITDVNPIFTPRYFAAEILGNFYFSQANTSMTFGLTLNPYAIGYSGSYYFAQGNIGWYTYFTDGYAGIGLSYTPLFEYQLWDLPPTLKYSIWNVYLGGFKNENSDKLNIGFSFQELLAANFLLGPSFSLTLSNTHDAKYLGQYPIDGKIASLRGLHKIEFFKNRDMLIRAGLNLGYFVGTTAYLTAAFIASAEHIKRQTFRTHIALKAKTNRKKDDSLKFMLEAYKKVKKNKFFPTFDKPLDFNLGDELIEKKTGILSGAFILGVQTILPIYSLLVGGSIDLTGEFELGLKRLAKHKFEVSIEIKKLRECSLFQNLLNLLYSSEVNGIGLAKKQSFLFDFSVKEAEEAYFDLIHFGRLPSKEEISSYKFERAPEYLLTRFRSQNELLIPKGVRLIYLEQINISTKKFFGVISPQVVPMTLEIVNTINRKSLKHKNSIKLSFDGYGFELLKAKSNSVSTNGIIAVSKEIIGRRNSTRRGLNGRYEKDLFITHKRVHTVSESKENFTESKYVFDSLMINAQIKDTLITDNGDNKIIDYLNHLFSTDIPNTISKNSKQPRIIRLEKHINRYDLLRLTENISETTIQFASIVSKIEQEKISEFLAKLKGHHPDDQATIIKLFINSNKGFKGFACIHQLLGAKPEELLIKVEGKYNIIADEAQKFILAYSSSDKKFPNKLVNLKISEVREDKKHIKKFFEKSYQYIEEIDKQMIFLYDDPFYLVENKNDNFSKLIGLGVRESKDKIKEPLVKAKTIILKMLDLRKQGYSLEDRKKIYEIAKDKRLGLIEQSEEIISSERSLRLNFIIKLKNKIKNINNDKKLMAMDEKNQQLVIKNLTKSMKKLNETL